MGLEDERGLADVHRVRDLIPLRRLHSQIVSEVPIHLGGRVNGYALYDLNMSAIIQHRGLLRDSCIAVMLFPRVFRSCTRVADRLHQLLKQPGSRWTIRPAQ